jgi:ketosteroid isomerase-like protein
MSQENVAIVEAVFAAYMRGDDSALRTLVAADVVISTRPDQPDVRDHHGHEGLLSMSAEWLEAWDEHVFEAGRITDRGDVVFVQTRESGRGRTSGVPMKLESTFVFTLSRGKVTALQIFSSEREALEVVGLAE